MIFKQHTFIHEIPAAFIELERMSITEVVHALYQGNSFHKPSLTHDGAKKALEGTAWADVSISEELDDFYQIELASSFFFPRVYEG